MQKSFFFLQLLNVWLEISNQGISWKPCNPFKFQAQILFLWTLYLDLLFTSKNLILELSKAYLFKTLTIGFSFKIRLRSCLLHLLMSRVFITGVEKKKVEKWNWECIYYMWIINGRCKGRQAYGWLYLLSHWVFSWSSSIRKLLFFISSLF